MSDELRNSLTIEISDKHKIAQAIYHAVTGKTERISRSFTENYRVDFADIEQLFAKCDQMCTQWHVLNRSTNITVHHLDENTQNFSSLERFRAYDQSQTSPVEALTIEFNLLLGLPNIEKPQPYKIVIRSISAITLMRRMEQDMPPPTFLRFFRAGPIVAEIDYVDYIVARSMMAIINSWMNEVQISKKNKLLSFVQNNSHWIPRISGAVLLLLSAIASYKSAPSILSANAGDQLLAQFLIATFAFVAASLYLGSWLGRFTENFIDKIQELSYVKLNRGDDRQIIAFNKRNRLSGIYAAVTFILITIHAILCGIFASHLYMLIMPK